MFKPDQQADRLRWSSRLDCAACPGTRCHCTPSAEWTFACSTAGSGGVSRLATGCIAHGWGCTGLVCQFVPDYLVVCLCMCMCEMRVAAYQTSAYLARLASKSSSSASRLRLLSSWCVCMRVGEWGDEQKQVRKDMDSELRWIHCHLGG
jgi:hypothetical protein